MGLRALGGVTHSRESQNGDTKTDRRVVVPHQFGGDVIRLFHQVTVIGHRRPKMAASYTLTSPSNIVVST